MKMYYIPLILSNIKSIKIDKELNYLKQELGLPQFIDMKEWIVCADFRIIEILIYKKYPDLKNKITLDGDIIISKIDLDHLDLFKDSAVI